MAEQQSSKKVYVVEMGCYEASRIVGVFSSPEAAMAAFPVTRGPKVAPPTAGCMERKGGWENYGNGRWGNGLDWDDAASITEYELQGC